MTGTSSLQLEGTWGILKEGARKSFFEESKLLCMGGREKGGSTSCIQFYFADKVNQNLKYAKVCSKLAKNQISKYFNLSVM